MALAALSLWLVVTGYAVRELIIKDGGDDWELAYAVLATAAPVGVALTIGILGSATRGGRRSAVRAAGLAVSVLGCVFTALAAWATPVWMTLLALGFALLAAAAMERARRPITLLAVAAGCGVATQFSLLALGASEETAADGALLFVAVATMLVLGAGLRTDGLAA